MLDVLQAVAFSLVFSTGVMRLVDWIDRPSQKKGRARSGTRARHEA